MPRAKPVLVSRSVNNIPSWRVDFCGWQGAATRNSGLNCGLQRGQAREDAARSVSYLRNGTLGAGLIATVVLLAGGCAADPTRPYQGPPNYADQVLHNTRYAPKLDRRSLAWRMGTQPVQILGRGADLRRVTGSPLIPRQRNDLKLGRIICPNHVGFKALEATKLRHLPRPATRQVGQHEIVPADSARV